MTDVMSTEEEDDVQMATSNELVTEEVDARMETNKKFDTEEDVDLQMKSRNKLDTHEVDEKTEMNTEMGTEDGFDVKMETNDKCEEPINTFELTFDGIVYSYSLYQLLELKIDKQNGAIVDKILISKKEVHRLCNDVVPKSCIENGAWINFKKLQLHSHEFLGVWGHKPSILTYFKNSSLIKWSDELDRMWDGKHPGIFAFICNCNGKRITFLVVWPPPNAFDDIQGKSNSFGTVSNMTLLIRYLTQMCSKIVACFDENCAKNFPEKVIERVSMRCISGKIQNQIKSEEKFVLHDGLSLNLRKEVFVYAGCIPMMNGLGFMIRELLPQKENMVPRFFTVNIKQLNSVLEKYYLVLSDQMSFKDKSLFFNHYSDDTIKIMEELNIEEALLENEFSSIKKTEVDRILENEDFPHSCLCAFLNEFSDFILPKCPIFASLLFDCLKDEPMEKHIKELEFFEIHPKQYLNKMMDSFDSIDTKNRTLVSSAFKFFKSKVGFSSGLNWEDIDNKDSNAMEELKNEIIKNFQEKIRSFCKQGFLSKQKRVNFISKKMDEEFKKKLHVIQEDYLEKLECVLAQSKCEHDFPKLVLDSFKLKSKDDLDGKGHVVEFEEKKFRYKIFQFLLHPDGENTLSRNPWVGINPKCTQLGNFEVAESCQVIGCYLAKNIVIIIYLKNNGTFLETRYLNQQMNSRRGMVKPFGKKITLTSFDQHLRLLSLYILEKGDEDDVEKSEITLYRFDEKFSYLSQVSNIINLCTLSEDSEITHISFFDGCNMLAFANNENLIRYFDTRQKTLLPQRTQLESDLKIKRLLSTHNGLCLMVILEKEDGSTSVLPVMNSSFNTLPSIDIPTGKDVDWVSHVFGSQNHQQNLTFYDHEQKILFSKVVEVTGLEQFRVICPNESQSEKNEESTRTPLDYLMFVFDKFAVRGIISDATNSNLHVSVMFDCSKTTFEKEKVSKKTIDYMQHILRCLERNKKPLHDLNLVKNLKVGTLEDLKPNSGSTHFESVDVQSFGDWIQKLICLLPIQISRAEENNFLVLSDGLLLPKEESRNVKECAEGISLGMYEAIFNWWKGPVLAISSMGKQSTGKSYTLNHLFGTSFEISGARCTDGCWLTVLPVQGVLFVILDFEGLGSFERTNQEDMLLSVFNSAISGLTIFKTEYRIDRDVEQMFKCFESGVDYIKGNEKLFKGQFFIAIKDVEKRDVKSIQDEFWNKIQTLIAVDQSKDEKGSNFISKMFNSEFTIFPFSNIGCNEYYEELVTIKDKIDERDIHFHSGAVFSECMKILMAKMFLKDWASLERQEIESRIDYLKNRVEHAFLKGKPETLDYDLDDGFKCLDTNTAIEEKSLIDYFIGFDPLSSNRTFMDALENEKDCMLELPADADKDGQLFMHKLFEKFSSLYIPREDASNHQEWVLCFSKFVDSLVKRRVDFVLTWAKVNLDRFLNFKKEETHQPDAECERYVEHVESIAQKIMESWKVCKLPCNNCFFGCLLPKNHKMDEHSCLGNHKCNRGCIYCKSEGLKMKCEQRSGHDGNHMCLSKPHTCGKQCEFSECLNCNMKCAKIAMHDETKGRNNGGDGDKVILHGNDLNHLCNSLVHLCGKPCSAQNCSNRCNIVYGFKHTVHCCIEIKCTHQCDVEGCIQSCIAKDHFHNSPNSKIYKNENMIKEDKDLIKFEGKHFCGLSHHCKSICSKEGICNVKVELKQDEYEVFEGARGKFRYKSIPEAVGCKEPCRIPIPPYKLEHTGAHVHSTDPRVIHRCDKKCPTCLYFCEKEYGHVGLHSGAHGMMRNCYFVSNQKNIDIGSRKYVVGESGKAEMCNMFCRSLGRGHIHILKCDARNHSQCTHAPKDGRRHQTCRYGPNEFEPKDELTHEYFFATIGWEDPCSPSEQQDFSKCGATCGHEDHLVKSSNESHCTLDIWHDAISKSKHTFNCTHFLNQYHVIFVLDRSGSMNGQPTVDLNNSVKEFIRTRRRNSTGDICSVVEYSSHAHVTFQGVALDISLTGRLHYFGGGTDFRVALLKSIEVMKKVKTSNPNHCPLLLFMSDGECQNGQAEMRRIKDEFQGDGLLVYVVGFGSRNSYSLESLASIGNGTYISTVNGIDLKNAYSTIAFNLSKKVTLVPK